MVQMLKGILPMDENYKTKINSCAYLSIFKKHNICVVCMKTGFTKKKFCHICNFHSFMNTPNVTYVTKLSLGNHVFIQHINCVY